MVDKVSEPFRTTVVRVGGVTLASAMGLKVGRGVAGVTVLVGVRVTLALGVGDGGGVGGAHPNSVRIRPKPSTRSLGEQWFGICQVDILVPLPQCNEEIPYREPL